MAMAMSSPASSRTLPLPKCPSYHRPIARKRLHLLVVSALLPAIQKNNGKSKTNPGLITGRRLMKRVSSRPNRGTLRIAAALVLASALTAQAQQPTAPAQAPIKIGIVTFLTGPAAAPFGIPGRNAAEVLVEMLNAGRLPAPYSQVGLGGPRSRRNTATRPARPPHTSPRNPTLYHPTHPPWP